MTYCLLVEDVWDAQVTHGIIKHRGQHFEIPHGPAERKRVLALAEEIRQSRRMSAVRKRSGAATPVLTLLGIDGGLIVALPDPRHQGMQLVSLGSS
jgi:hypothetical protein